MRHDKLRFHYMLLCLLGWACLAAMAGPDMATTRLALFARDEILRGPADARVFAFMVSPGEQFVECPVLALSCRFTADAPARASLTVALNGSPLASRDVTLPAAPAPLDWQMPLPLAALKTGLNEVRITGRYRARTGDTPNADATRGWARLGRDARITFHRAQPATYPLAWYPYPYLDPLATPAVQSTLVLPQSFTAPDVEALLDTASDWGFRCPLRGLPMRVQIGEDASPRTHQIIFTPADKLLAIVGHPAMAPTTGWLWTAPQGPAGGMSLLVSGDDAAGREKAVRALGVPQTTARFAGHEAFITEMPDSVEGAVPVHLGTVTLHDLHVAPLELAGDFPRSRRITLLRPVRCALGRESGITVHFRHAADRASAEMKLLVTINGMPAGSVRLTRENAGGGILTVRIPVSQLPRPVWQVEFTVIPDSGAMDDGGRAGVAGVVIEDTTMCALTTGQLDCLPYLDHFPSLQTDGPSIPQPVTLWLSAHPTAGQLSLAASIAARAGQENRAPVRWHVVMGNTLESDPAGDACVIALGYHTETERFAPFAHALPAMPDTTGRLITAVPGVMPDALDGATLLQAARAPGNAHGVWYVLLAPNDAGCARVADLLTDPQQAWRITGDLCLIPTRGTPVAFTSRSPRETARMIQNEAESWDPSTFYIIVISVCAGVLVKLGTTYRALLRHLLHRAAALPALTRLRDAWAGRVGFRWEAGPPADAGTGCGNAASCPVAAQHPADYPPRETPLPPQMVAPADAPLPPVSFQPVEHSVAAIPNAEPPTWEPLPVTTPLPPASTPPVEPPAEPRPDAEPPAPEELPVAAPMSSASTPDIEPSETAKPNAVPPPVYVPAGTHTRPAPTFAAIPLQIRRSWKPGDWLTCNAYRVLGLSSTATREAIHDNAAVLLTVSHAPITVATPWDLPYLGPINRTGEEIGKAVAYLDNPIYRLIDRVFWFHQGEETLAKLTDVSLPIIAADWAQSSNPIRQHDGALLSLIRAQMRDAQMQYDLRWTQAMKLWQRVLASHDYWEYFTLLEAESRHPRVADATIWQEFRRQVFEMVMEGLNAEMERAAACRDAECFQRGVRVARHLELAPELFSIINGEMEEFVKR